MIRRMTIAEYQWNYVGQPLNSAAWHCPRCKLETDGYIRRFFTETGRELIHEACLTEEERAIVLLQEMDQLVEMEHD